MVETDTGTLYVVATPIGNLADLSPRGRDTLGEVAVIAAEDTRHTGRLLAAFGLQTPLLSLHEHNERGRIDLLLERLRTGEDVALVSDAGTPLIADPGYHVVAACQAAGIEVRAVPGPCAMAAALSCSGLPTDRFRFEGFLPARRGPRRSRLEDLARCPETLVFYEAPHRIEAALADLSDLFGGGRPGWIGRELTKRFEQQVTGPLEELAAAVADGTMPARGEFVVVVGGCPDQAGSETTALDLQRLVDALLEELPASRVARVAARISGRPRQELYALALERGRD